MSTAATAGTEREHHCLQCGFDLSKLDMTILWARKGSGGRRLCCPLCRGPVSLGAVNRLFFRPSTLTWVRWSETGAGASPNVLSVGRLKLRIAGEIETLSRDKICFRAVPTFQSNGTRVWPALPVRPEYMDCIDPKRLVEVQRDPGRFGRVIVEGGRSRFQYTLPLRGLEEKEWPTQTCDVLPADPHALPTAANVDTESFRGVSLRLWPNLKRPYPGWRFYLLSLGAATEEGTKLFSRGRDVSAQMLVPRGQGDGVLKLGDVAYEWRPIATPHGVEGDAGPTSLVGASTAGRPLFVAMEFRNTLGTSSEPLGGGLFAVPPHDETASPSTTWTFGLDFGTSNTVVATKYDDDTRRPLRPERGRNRVPTTLYLLNGGEQQLFRGLDLWPGGTWSGPYNDLLPSELGSLHRWVENAQPEKILALRFGEEFGIPLRAALSRVSGDYVVSEFKWIRAVEKDKSALANPSTVQAIQTRFLESAMLMSAAARLSEEDLAPQTVHVNYSFPLAFEDNDLHTLRKATEEASRSLKSLTGIEFLFQDPNLDEAQAAVASEPTDKMFRVYLDLGGGSFEVLVEDTWARKKEMGHAGLHPHVFSTSIFYGGSVYLRSLVGQSEADRQGTVLMPSVASYTQLASLVRSMSSGAQLVSARHVVQEVRQEKARRRARAYFGYLVELIARVLAGVCLEHGRTEDGRLDLSRNRLFTLSSVGGQKRWTLGTVKGQRNQRTVEFELVLLGNGWGFGEIVLDGMGSVEQMMALRVQARLLKLLQSTPVAKQLTDGEASLVDAQGRPGVQLEVSFVPPQEGTHRKARVAVGLLESSSVANDQRGYQDAPERHGVLGFDLWLNDTGRRIPWYRPFGQPAQDNLQETEREAANDPLAHAPAVSASPYAGVQPSAAPSHLAPPVAGMGALAPQAPPEPRGASPMFQTLPGVPSAMAPGGLPAGLLGGAPAPVMPAMGTMPPEQFAWLLVSQPAQLTALVQRYGVDVATFAQRDTWPQLQMRAMAMGMNPQGWATQVLQQCVLQVAAQSGKSWELLLAEAEWTSMSAQTAQSHGLAQLSPEQSAWLQQQVAAQAAQQGQTPVAWLAHKRMSWLQGVFVPPAAPAAPAGMPGGGGSPFPFG